MKSYGAIDIGTNSVRILVAEIEDGAIVKSFKELKTTRIGEKVDQRNILSPEAMDDTIEALKELVGIGKAWGVDTMPIIATSAVRDAENKAEFLRKVKEQVGFDIEVISGEEEAQLGFLGVQKGLKEQSERILVIDIGGGSTEFILGDGKGISYMVSLNMGAVRMTEKFVSTDPIGHKELYAMQQAIDDMLIEVIEKLKESSFHRIIVIGGTVTSLGAVAQEMKVYNRDKVHNFELSHEKVKELSKLFSIKSLEERKCILGLHPKRADIILAGTVILDRILDLIGFDGIRISEYDNLEGLIFQQLAKNMHN